MNRLVLSIRAWRMMAGDVGSKMEAVWPQFGMLSLCPIHSNVFINAGDDNEAYCLYGH